MRQVAEMGNGKRTSLVRLTRAVLLWRNCPRVGTGKEGRRALREIFFKRILLLQFCGVVPITPDGTTRHGPKHDSPALPPT